jgi:hypothetical protein
MKTSAGGAVVEQNSKTKLAIVADLGRFKAYRWEENRAFSRPRLKLIEDHETPQGTHHLSEDVTDQAGRFRKEPAFIGALSDGEEHNLKLERRNRAVRSLAKEIGAVMKREHATDCYMAADHQIMQSILAALDQPTRAKVSRRIPANLSKHRPEELVERFCAPPQTGVRAVAR